MELNKIEQLLAQYFEGNTTIAEEKGLKDYFTSSQVPPHLKQYQSLFGYFSNEKRIKGKAEYRIPTKESFRNWWSIAASVIVLLSVGTYTIFNYQTKSTNDLGTYEDPEVAFRATQKALSVLSTQVNVGIESVHYINEYEQAKNKVFPSN